MTPQDTPATISWDNAGTGWQASPPENDALSVPELPDTNNMNAFWTACGRGLACTCGTAAGAATSHIGCIVSPTLAFMGAASGASLSTVSVIASTALTGAGLALWYKLRGKVAGRLEKGLTIAGALTGAVMTASLHLSGAFAGHDHHSTIDAALDWYRGQSQTMQTDMQESARMLGMSLEDYVLQICGRPGTENISYPTEGEVRAAFEAISAETAPKRAGPGLDKL